MTRLRYGARQHVARSSGFARATQQPYDDGGRWAASGVVDRALLDACLAEPFFGARRRSRTGRELFNREWLDEQRARASAPRSPPSTCRRRSPSSRRRRSPQRYEASCPAAARCIVCGGGVHNDDLMTRLAPTHCYARQRRRIRTACRPTGSKALRSRGSRARALRCLAGNVPTVTGARRHAILGGVYWGRTP